MTNNLIFYLLWLFFYRLFEFFRHWYVKSFFIYSDKILNLFSYLDKFFALKVTLRHFFQPLFQDYSLIGYLFGFIFRSLRILISLFVYLLVFLLALFIYLFWLAIPIYLIFKIFI